MRTIRSHISTSITQLRVDDWELVKPRGGLDHWTPTRDILNPKRCTASDWVQNSSQRCQGNLRLFTMQNGKDAPAWYCQVIIKSLPHGIQWRSTREHSCNVKLYLASFFCLMCSAAINNIQYRDTLSAVSDRLTTNKLGGSVIQLLIAN